MQLTAKQIKTINEIGLDKRTAEATLNIALTHHANMLNQNIKREIAFWDELKEQYRLDPEKDWKINGANIEEVIK